MRGRATRQVDVSSRSRRSPQPRGSPQAPILSPARAPALPSGPRVPLRPQISLQARGVSEQGISATPWAVRRSVAPVRTDPRPLLGLRGPLLGTDRALPRLGESRGDAGRLL